jgi:hypothetical protein
MVILPNLEMPAYLLLQLASPERIPSYFKDIMGESYKIYEIKE